MFGCLRFELNPVMSLLLRLKWLHNELKSFQVMMSM